MKWCSATGIGLGLVVLTAATLTGCSGDDNGTKPCVGSTGGEISVPLNEGDRWVYTFTQTRLGDTDAFERVDLATGTEQIDGESFAELRSIVTEVGSAVSDTAFSYMRQIGQQLFVHQLYDTTGVSEHEIDAYILTNIVNSLPWQLADFSSSDCDSWNLLDVSNTWSLEGGGETKVDLKIVISNEGRTDLTVPIGTYEDVYIAKLVLDFGLIQNRPPIPPIQTRQMVTQQFYLADGIGTVREESETRFTQTGAEPTVVSSIAVLESYDPAN